MSKSFKNNRYNQINLFSNITQALTKLYNEDDTLFKAKYHHSITHRLAMYLEDELRNPNEIGHLFDQDIYVDVDFPIPWIDKSRKADLVIHSRGKNPILAATVKNTYFSTSSLIELYKAQLKNLDGLYLAIRLANDKKYALIYKCVKDGIEYYHYDYETQMIKMKMKKKVKGKDKLQLKLF